MSEQMPKYAAWRAGFEADPGPFAYLAQHVSITTAAVFAEFMCPKFVQVKGCVLREASFDAKNFEVWWERLDGEVRRIERVINHVHLWDVFDSDDECEVTEDEALFAITEALSTTWRVSAAAQYPALDFESEVTDDYGPSINIWQAIG